MNIEESFKEIEDIIEKLENKEISLEEAFVYYEKGVALIKECNQSIDKVQKQIIKLQEEE